MEEHAHLEGGGFKGFIGIVLIILGLFLGGYAAWTYFFEAYSEEKVSTLLPQEGLQLIVFASEIEEKTPEIKYIEKLSKIILPKTGGIAIYKREEGLSFLSFQKKNETIKQIEEQSNGQYCEEIQKILFCSSQKQLVLSILDGIKTKKQSLSLVLEYKNALKEISGDASLRFFGRTKFLSQQIWEDLSEKIPSDSRPQFSIFTKSIPDEIPFFAGSIEGKNHEVFFIKKNITTIFPASLAKYDMSAQFFPFEVNRYLYLSRPDFLWEKALESIEKKNTADHLIFKGWAENKIANLFGKNISFLDQIFPLLSGNIAFLATDKGEGVFFSLPNAAIAKHSFEILEQGLKQRTAAALPIKIGHKLSNGTMMYEVFPNEENIEVIHQSDSNGRFTLFANTNPETGEEFVVGSVQKGSYLMIATDKDLLSRFWSLKGEPTDFVLPNESGVFTSFGIKANNYKKREIRKVGEAKEVKEIKEGVEEKEGGEEKTKKEEKKAEEIFLIPQIEGKGIEKENGLYFFIEVTW